jgi:predicted DNA-binding protein YlxM (UPF0122 family)
MSMLFDFFGDLLTEKQREYFDLHHNEDLSLSEIAENVGITRQGVYDIVLRAENTLLEMEEKTGVIKRFNEIQSEIDRALRSAEELSALIADTKAAGLAAELVNILSKLKG